MQIIILLKQNSYELHVWEINCLPIVPLPRVSELLDVPSSPSELLEDVPSLKAVSELLDVPSLLFADSSEDAAVELEITPEVLEVPSLVCSVEPVSFISVTIAEAFCT